MLDGDLISSETDVTPDAFQFDGISFPPNPTCLPPSPASQPVTSGNIIIINVVVGAS